MTTTRPTITAMLRRYQAVRRPLKCQSSLISNVQVPISPLLEESVVLSSSSLLLTPCYHHPEALLVASTPTTPTHTRRQFSSRARDKRSKNKIDPFKALKVKRQTPYASAKKIFLKIAMQHHPDTSSAKTEKEASASRDIFINARHAFEEIAEDPETGGLCLQTELADYVPDEEHTDMDDWFKQQTGHDMPFMDEETMKEVARMTESVGKGMDRGGGRDGGMWDLARQVTQALKSGGDGKNLLKLEAGEVKNTTMNPNLRARRRKK